MGRGDIKKEEAEAKTYVTHVNARASALDRSTDVGLLNELGGKREKRNAVTEDRGE